MAKAAAKKKKQAKKAKPLRIQPLRWLRRWSLRILVSVAGFFAVLILLYSVVNPPTTHTIWSESRRLDGVDREWVPLEEIAPVMARSVVAAEDARFCQHWGFDVQAIRAAIEGGARRGGSTLTQQVVKNVFLWQNRSWLRKALETALTPVVEAAWSKRRILEIYLNVAEFDEGIFGVEAASRHYFRVGPEELSPRQAALLAAILPDPKGRSAAKPSARTSKRAASIMDGAATIRYETRAACFED